MKVLIADDHAIVRKGLLQIVSSLQSIKEVEEAENGREVLEKFEIGKYQLLILDLSMPVLNGLDTLKILINKDPEIKVLILSIYPEEQYAIKAYKFGAYGYINKNAASVELKKAVEQILTGKKYLSTTLATKIMDYQDFDKPISERLSKREYQIMMMSAEGISSKEISEKLSISPKTISTYRSRILEKLNLQNFVQLMHFLNFKNL
ncbi:MAG: response regulator transcription factor [Ignavibacteriae bacterium]|nr:response regulator transcription factor [Ignavibacteriota bacterium]